MDALRRINILFPKYLNKQITETEFDELLIWLAGLSDEESQALAESNMYLWDQAKSGKLSASGNVDWNKVLENVIQSDTKVVSINRSKRLWIRVAAAAVIFLVLSAGAWLLLNRHEKPAMANKEITPVRLPENVLPGMNRATLTLGNGSQIILDSAANGKLAIQKGANVEKLDSGKLAYIPSANNKGEEVVYNTITVPRGGQYQLLLADGSKVWLNAASSLRYPTTFTGKDRRVELTGEAYFEVAKNKAMPFHVLYKDMDVRVLGTHFNVMAYEDEATIKTSLLEGSVKISNGNNSSVLVPGKQAELSRGNGRITVSDANVDMAVAWVKGYFYFDKADVKAIMRQVSRWYDLDIVYAGKVPDDLFSGKIQRDLPLSGIIHLLGQGKIQLSVEGNKLIVR